MYNTQSPKRSCPHPPQSSVLLATFLHTNYVYVAGANFRVGSGESQLIFLVLGIGVPLTLVVALLPVVPRNPHGLVLLERVQFSIKHIVADFLCLLGLTSGPHQRVFIEADTFFLYIGHMILFLCMPCIFFGEN